MPKANLWGDILMEQELTEQLTDAFQVLESEGGSVCNARNFRNKRIRPHQMGRKGKEQPGNRCNQNAQKAKKLNVNNCPRLPIGKPRILKKKRTLSMEMTVDEMADEMRFRLWESKLIQLRELIKELGKDKSIEIMEQVTKSELEGGVFDPARAQRRLPGGVFIHYIRQRSDVDQEAIKNILDKHRSLSENSKKFKKRQNKLNSVAKENANAEKAADEAPMEAEVAPPNPDPQQIIVKEIEEPIVAAN